MNKKVNKIIKQKLNYKKELQTRLPGETCNKIWKNIHQRLTSFYEEYNDLPKGVASHTDASCPILMVSSTKDLGRPQRKVYWESGPRSLKLSDEASF